MYPDPRTTASGVFGETKMSKSRFAVIAAFASMGCIAIAACAAPAQPPPANPASDVTLAIQFPGDVNLSATQRTSQTIVLTLTNNSSSAVTLERPNLCQAHTWTATDSAGQVIDGQSICPMIFIPVKQALPAHAPFAATESMSMDGSKYKDGAHYTLHYSFWGVSADAEFTAHLAK
jgi:hypothetical protein